MKVLDKKNFETEVVQSEGTMLVDFFSETCEPCQALMPSIEALDAKYSDKMPFAKLDTAKARRVAIGQKFSVSRRSPYIRMEKKLKNW